jgi:hypothetical protein
LFLSKSSERSTHKIAVSFSYDRSLFFKQLSLALGRLAADPLYEVENVPEQVLDSAFRGKGFHSKGFLRCGANFMRNSVINLTRQQKKSQSRA